MVQCLKQPWAKALTLLVFDHGDVLNVALNAELEEADQPASALPGLTATSSKLTERTISSQRPVYPLRQSPSLCPVIHLQLRLYNTSQYSSASSQIAPPIGLLRYLLRASNPSVAPDALDHSHRVGGVGGCSLREAWTGPRMG
jgi:hypothetical protein